MKNKTLSILLIVLCVICLFGTTSCGIIKKPLDNNTSNGNNTNNNNQSQNQNGQSESSKYTKESLEMEISNQPVVVYSTEYLVQDEDYKCLYPDLLIANIKNNSGKSIKNAEIAFVAWDSNGFPIKIDSKYGRDSYVQIVDFDDVNLTNGQTYDDTGLALGCTYESKIKTFKAIVKSYTDFEENTWQNPLYTVWKDFYENKPLDYSLSSNSSSDSDSLAGNSGPVKVYVFNAKGCSACESQIDYLKGLSSYNKKFQIIEKELYVDTESWGEGKDFNLAKNVAKEFNKVGFNEITETGAPMVIISNVYATTGYYESLEGYINQAYNAGDKDVVGCIEKGNSNCLK